MRCMPCGCISSRAYHDQPSSKKLATSARGDQTEEIPDGTDGTFLLFEHFIKVLALRP